MNERSELAARLDALHGVCVLCVGDIMLDRYVEGAAERISPEAPVPVLRVERQSAMLGGASIGPASSGASGLRLNGP